MNKKILVAEDDINFSDILQREFTSEGFIVVAARDGKECLDLLEKEKPDLIVLDILMPRMDGLETAKRIKESGVDVPIIFLTNVKDIDSMSRALEITESDYFVKSDLKIAEIVNRVKDKLGHKV
jgi:DNA-binding response OmpR family regulator